MTTVSIAMATYNGARYIAEQLQSLIDQTRRPDQIVITDDQSTDETIEIARRVLGGAGIDTKIIVNVERLRVTRNFEAAVHGCDGDIIFLCDQDDRWFPEKVETVLAAFAANSDALLIVNDQIVCNHDLTVCGARKSENFARMGHGPLQMSTGCCTAFRRELAELALPFSANQTHDNWVNRMAALLGAKLFLPVPLQLYRRHDANVSTSRASAVDMTEQAPGATRISADHLVRSLQRKERIQDDTVRRFSERADWLAANGKEAQATTALMTLRRQQRATAGRIGAIGRPLLARTATIARNYLAGHYVHDRGWRTAIADVLRR